MGIVIFFISLLTGFFLIISVIYFAFKKSTFTGFAAIAIIIACFWNPLIMLAVMFILMILGFVYLLKSID